MANEWKIRRGDVQPAGSSGQLLDGLEVREMADGSGFELIAVVARTEGNVLPAKFLPFAYRGVIWHDMEIQSLTHGPDANQPWGPWHNNQHSRLPAEEDGTWTAQAGSGGAEEDGMEDAASASA